MAAIVTEGERAVTARGTATKPLYIKHVSLDDWNAIKRIQAMIGDKTVAEAVRFAIRKTAGLNG